jgi:serpin B
LVLLLAACSEPAELGDTGPRTPPPGEVVVGAQAVVAPDVPAETLSQLVRDNTEAALALFRASAPPDTSFVFSPHSVALALAMTYEGARGETERQMAEALRFALPKPQLHDAFARLARELNQGAVESLHLRIINALFGQTGFAFNQPFIDTVTSRYQAPLSRLDFVGAAGAARGAINDWVSKETDGMVPALLPEGLPNVNTVLVLTNAIAFRGVWRNRFMPNGAPFELRTLAGSTATVPSMYLTGSLPYAKGPDWQAVELPYDGDRYSMVVLLPGRIPDDTVGTPAPFEKAVFADFEARLDAAQLATIATSLLANDVTVYLPQFTVRSAVRLEPPLEMLGMKDAFTSRADLSGIAGGPGYLFIQAVVHEAFIEVDPIGTRAAAATAVSTGRKSASRHPILRADRPFIFFIRERSTGAVIFLGRYTG